MKYSFLVGLVIALAASITCQGDSGDPPENHAKKAFAVLRTSLPGIVQRSQLPKVFDPKDKEKLLYFSRIRLVRQTSEVTGKITISVHFMDNDDKSAEIINLFMRYHDGKWTVDRHECSRFFQDGAEKDKLLRLILLIDESQK